MGNSDLHVGQNMASKRQEKLKKQQAAEAAKKKREEELAKRQENTINFTTAELEEGVKFPVIRKDKDGNETYSVFTKDNKEVTFASKEEFVKDFANQNEQNYEKDNFQTQKASPTIQAKYETTEDGNKIYTIVTKDKKELKYTDYDKFKKEYDKIFAKDSVKPAPQKEKTIQITTKATIQDKPISKTEYKSINWVTDKKGNIVPELTKDGKIQIMDSDGSIRLADPKVIQEAAKIYAPKNGNIYEETTGEKVGNAITSPIAAIGTAYEHVLGDHDGRASLKIVNNPWGLKTAGVVGEVGAVATDAVSVVAEGGEKAFGFVNKALTMESSDKPVQNALVDAGNSVTSVLGIVEGTFQAVKGGFDTTSSYLKAEDSTNAMLETVRNKALENIAKIDLDETGLDNPSRTLLEMFNEGDTPENKSQILALAHTNGIIEPREMIELQNNNSFEEIVNTIKPRLNYEAKISERQVEDSSALFSIGFRLGLTTEQMKGKSNSELREYLKEQKSQKLGVYKSMTSEELAQLSKSAYEILTTKGGYDLAKLSDADRQKLIDLGISREEIVLLAADLAKDAEMKKLAALVVEQRADGKANFQAGVTKASESVGKVADLPSNIIKVAEATDIPVIREVSGAASGALDTVTGVAGTALNGAVDLFTGNWGFDRTKKSAQKTANGAKHMVTLGHGKDIYKTDGEVKTNMPPKGLQEYKSNTTDGVRLGIAIEDILEAKKDKDTGLYVVGGMYLSKTSYNNLKKMAKKGMKADLDTVSVKSEDFLPAVHHSEDIINAKDLGNNTYKIKTGRFSSEIISAQEYQEIIDNYNKMIGEANQQYAIKYPESLQKFINSGNAVQADDSSTAPAAALAAGTGAAAATTAPALSKKEKFVKDGEYAFNYYQDGSIQDIMLNEHITNQEKHALMIALFKKEITKMSLTEEHKERAAALLAAQIAENDKSFALAILTGAYKCTGELNDGELGLLKRSLALFVGPFGNALQGAFQHPVTTIGLAPVAWAAPGWTYAFIGGTDSLYGINNALIRGSFNDSVATYETTRILKPFWWHHGHHHKKCGEITPEPQPVDPWCPQVPDPWCPQVP